MTDKTAAERMRVKPGARVLALFAPHGVVRALGLPEGSTMVTSTDDADVILMFAASQAEFDQRLASLRSALRPGVALWICYPKGSKAAGMDISRDTIWAAAEPLGYRPVGLVSIDDTWSGFRLKIAE
jgi:hypothetical protein